MLAACATLMYIRLVESYLAIFRVLLRGHLERTLLSQTRDPGGLTANFLTLSSLGHPPAGPRLLYGNGTWKFSSNDSACEPLRRIGGH